MTLVTTQSRTLTSGCRLGIAVSRDLIRERLLLTLYQDGALALRAMGGMSLQRTERSGVTATPPLTPNQVASRNTKGYFQNRPSEGQALLSLPVRTPET